MKSSVLVLTLTWINVHGFQYSTVVRKRALELKSAVVSQPSLASKPAVAETDKWVLDLDYEGFGKEVSDLGKEMLKEGGEDDVNHLGKMVLWRNIAAVIGIGSMWMVPNPLTVLALSTWTYASWTMIAHHTCHGGYNRMNGSGYSSRGFGLGVVERVRDWLDWMAVEAWNVEHNRLHHYRLNEEQDPDLVQRNLLFLREMNIPKPLKYVVVAGFLPIWKWFYYAPNTYKELQIAKYNQPLPSGFDPLEACTMKTLFLENTPQARAMRQIVNPTDFLLKVVGPFFFMRFILLPLPLLFFNSSLFIHAIINILLAELLTNVHSFITIVTNHAGEDMYTFDDAVRPKSNSFYVRQIIGSTNYDYGSNPIDFCHGWLNYQIEHHVWPDFSMLQYQKAAPKLKGICEKYGVPYVQENVFTRLRKTVDIMVGNTSMRPFPTQYEPTTDKVKSVSWKTTNGAIDDDS